MDDGLRPAVRPGCGTVLGTPAYAERARALATTAPSGLAAARATELLATLAGTGRPVTAAVSPR